MLLALPLGVHKGHNPVRYRHRGAQGGRLLGGVQHRCKHAVTRTATATTSITLCIGRAEQSARQRNSSGMRYSSVLEKVRMYTGGWCESIASPICSDALQDAAKAQHSCAALLPARITNTNVKELLFKAHHVAFLSPLLIDTQEGETRRRCVEGSLIAFFSENPSTFLHNTSARPIRFSMLSPTNCTTC